MWTGVLCQNPFPIGWPLRDSNPHWIDFKSIASAVGLRGRRLRIATRRGVGWWEWWEWWGR